MCRTTLPAMLAAAAMLAPACGPAIAAGTCQVGILAELAVDNPASHRVITHGEINGQPARILIDTGAAYSVLWRTSVPALGLKPLDSNSQKLYGIGGESKVQYAHLDELKISHFVTRNISFPVSGDRPMGFDLLLGEDVLSRYTLEFDLGHQTVRLLTHKDCRPEQLAYWAKTYALVTLAATPRAGGMIQPLLKLNGREIRAELDSGAGYTVVSTVFAKNAGAVDVVDAGKTFGLGKDTLELQIGTFNTIAVGDELVNHATIELAELNHNVRREETGSRIAAQKDYLPEMLLGTDFLLSHRVVIPEDAKQMMFTYEGGPVFQHRPRATATPAPETPPAREGE